MSDSRRKLTISLETTLIEQIRSAAESASGGNVSAWLAEAIRMALRNQAAGELLDEYEAEHGEITAEEVAAIDRELWPKTGVRGRVLIPVQGMEFDEGGSTIWVQGMHGTVLRIKMSGNILTRECDGFSSHADIQAEGDLKFCLAGDGVKR